MALEIEKNFGIRLTLSETRPVYIDKILSRFGHEYEREQGAINTQALVARSPLAAALLQQAGTHFESQVSPQDCPFYQLVLAGSLFVGLGNPTDIERLNQILCGHVVTSEDTIKDGILSGRKGDDYQPKSQCWRITVELARLVEFMRQTEEVPLIPDHIKDEAELLKLLSSRDEIRRRNNSRQIVFETWNDIRSNNPTLFKNQAAGGKLPSPHQEIDVDEKAITVTDPAAYDASAQLNVGGPEYQELIDWVDQSVLQPMMNLVGETNLGLYLGAKSIKLSLEDTAENCPKKPYAFFSGSFS